MSLFFRNRPKHSSLVIDLSPSVIEDSDKPSIEPVGYLGATITGSNHLNINSKQKTGLYKSQVQRHVREKRNISSQSTIDIEASLEALVAKNGQPIQSNRKDEHKVDDTVKVLMARLKQQEVSFAELEQKYLQALSRLNSLENKELTHLTILKPIVRH